MARTVVLLSALAPVVARPVRAHVERYPKRDALAVSPMGVRLTVDYAVPRGDVARALRRIYDRDRSGALDDAERTALGKHLVREATAFLRVFLDGRDVPLATRTVLVDAGGEGDERISVHLELAGEAPLGAGEHRVRVADRHKDRRIAVPLAVTLEGGVVFRVRPPVLLTVDESHPAELALRR